MLHFYLLFGRDEDIPVPAVKVCRTSRRLLLLVPERGPEWGGGDWSNSRSGLFTAGKRTPGTFE